MSLAIQIGKELGECTVVSVFDACDSLTSLQTDLARAGMTLQEINEVLTESKPLFYEAIRRATAMGWRYGRWGLSEVCDRIRQKARKRELEEMSRRLAKVNRHPTITFTCDFNVLKAASDQVAAIISQDGKVLHELPPQPVSDAIAYALHNLFPLTKPQQETSLMHSDIRIPQETAADAVVAAAVRGFNLKPSEQPKQSQPKPQETGEFWAQIGNPRNWYFEIVSKKKGRTDTPRLRARFKHPQLADQALTISANLYTREVKKRVQYSLINYMLGHWQMKHRQTGSKAQVDWAECRQRLVKHFSLEGVS